MRLHLLIVRRRFRDGRYHEDVTALTPAQIDDAPEDYADLLAAARAEAAAADDPVIEYGVVTLDVAEGDVEAAFARVERGAPA